MSKDARKELLRSLKPQYQNATWTEKQRLLDGFVTATGYDRKYAIVLLNKDLVEPKGTRSRKRKYGPDIRDALLEVWRKAGNRLCSKRLVPILPTLIAKMEQFGYLKLSDEQKSKLVSLSPATIDRLLVPERRRYGRGKSRTKPGYLIKKQIAVRTFADWNDVKPGFVEADLVAHCGESVHGQFLHTLTVVDIATSWIELGALLRRSESDVMNALDELRASLPFSLLGLDTDNGGEFINYTLLDWCRENSITFTRSREYKKNDQAHVEERNGSVVRRLTGYDRYEGVESWRVLSSLYRVARLYINFFQPSMKLVSKSRDGGHVYRRYDRALTPYERVLKSSTVPEDSKERLCRQFDLLDPVLLLSEIERLQNEFWVTAVMFNEEAPIDTFPLVAAPNSIASPMKSMAGPTSRRPRRTTEHRRQFHPSPPGSKRGRKTNLDEVWPEILLEVELNPTISPIEILALLNSRYPERFRRTQLTTIHDKLSRWHHERSPDSTWTKGKPGRKTVIDDLWPEIVDELEKNPNITARGLMSLLCQRYPDRLRMTQRSTLMQRLSIWRKSHIESISIFPESSDSIVEHASTAERFGSRLQ